MKTRLCILDIKTFPLRVKIRKMNVCLQAPLTGPALRVHPLPLEPREMQVPNKQLRM